LRFQLKESSDLKQSIDRIKVKFVFIDSNDGNNVWLECIVYRIQKSNSHEEYELIFIPKIINL
jgi:hypothetical protein